MYKYYNRNPLERRLPDCVCRAISLATRTGYEQVRELLEENGLECDCEDLTVECYAKILTELGYETKEAEGKTVKGLCKECPENIILVRLEGHLTCCVNGCCYDIWDCTDKKADKYWIVS